MESCHFESQSALLAHSWASLAAPHFEKSGYSPAQESSYFSDNPWNILQLELFHLEDINENVSGYGNHN